MAHRKKQASKNYFTKETEKYIVEYNATDDPVKREKIFTEHIYYPFYKLAENIIHTFKFYHTDVDQLEDLKLDIVRMLWEEKIGMFDPSKGAKAYSYFGTIVKRWLIAYCNKNYDKKKKQVDVSVLENSTVNETVSSQEISPILSLSGYIDKWVEDTYSKLDTLFLKESDKVIADAVLTIFKTRQDLQVFQKKALYVYIREITGCETPYLTRVITKLKESFYEGYSELNNKGLIQTGFDEA